MDASRWRMLSPLVLSTMASQSLLVVLAPTIVAISADLQASVATVGQARSITAMVSVLVSLVLSARADRLPVRRQLRMGAALAVIACAAVAASGSTAVFLVSHVLVGAGFALLLSAGFAGFAGVAAFTPEHRAWPPATWLAPTRWRGSWSTPWPQGSRRVCRGALPWPSLPRSPLPHW